MLSIATLAMAVTVAANTNAAIGYTGANPVLIAACSLEPEVTYYDSGNEHLYLPEVVGESLKIRFSNATNKQISSVTFSVSDGNDQAEQVVDTGEFSPGITIAHSFQASVRDEKNLQCNVSSVAFSDGSNWMRPAATDTAVSYPRIH
jgi:hypothetical protein